MQITASTALRLEVHGFVPIFDHESDSRISVQGRAPSAMPSYSGGKITKREHKVWSHVSATLDHVESHGELRIDFEPGNPKLIVILDEVGGKLSFRQNLSVIGEGLHKTPPNGPISLLPAGRNFIGHSDQIRFLRLLVVDLDLPELKKILNESGGHVRALSARLMVCDPDIESICDLLAGECSDEDESGSLYADSLTRALMVAITRMKSGDVNDTARGGLSPTQLRRAQSFMMEHVGEGVSLSILAELTKVSLAHFCRSFKASTGKAPHRWFLEARIEQAKSYLIEKKTSIADISVMLGFCDQAHFTRTFGKIVGTTPLAWQNR